MTKKLLLLDCDGVIFDSTRLIDREVQNIEYMASDKYCDELNRLSARYHSDLHKLEIERSNNSEKEKSLRTSIEEVGRRRKHHFYLKDMVLEEVLPKYKNRINYDEIFQVENTYPGVINKIIDVCGMGIFDDIYVVSHYNSENEGAAKERFFADFLPMVKVVLVKFHQDEFSLLPEDEDKNKKRERTHKILDFQRQTGISDFSRSYFIDDTESIIEEARDVGVKHCFYKTKRENIVNLLGKALSNAFVETIELNNNKSYSKRRGK